MKKNSEVEQNKKYDFRRAFWGMSMEEVKKNETGKFQSIQENDMAFRDKVFGYSFFIVYGFENNKLYMGGMVCEEEYSDFKKYEENFALLKNNLSEIYGKPEIDKIFRNDEKLRKFRDNWGQTLTPDDLVMICNWISKNGRTQCTMILDRDKESNNMQIVFKDLSYNGPPSAYDIFLRKNGDDL